MLPTFVLQPELSVSGRAPERSGIPLGGFIGSTFMKEVFTEVESGPRGRHRGVGTEISMEGKLS